MKDFSQFINEVLTKSDPIEKWIHDFVHSDNPKFAGKSKEERIKMAQGAYYGAQKEEVGLDEATPYYNKASWIKKMSRAAKQERLSREKKEAEQKQVKEASEVQPHELKQIHKEYTGLKNKSTADVLKMHKSMHRVQSQNYTAGEMGGKEGLISDLMHQKHGKQRMAAYHALSNKDKKSLNEESGEHHDVEHVMKTMKKVDYDTYTKHMRKNDADHSMENKHGVDTQHSGSFTGKIHGAEIGHKHSKSGEKEYYIKEETVEESRGHKILATALGNMERMKTVQIPTPAERKAQLEKQKQDQVKKEETMLSFKEAAQDTLPQHKVIVTVSDPHHQAVSQRKEKVMKRVVVKALGRDEAKAKAEDFYKKKGYKVHDSEYHSKVPAATMKTEEVELEESWEVYDTKTRVVHSKHPTQRKALNAMNKLNDKHPGYETPGNLIASKFGARASMKEEVELDEAMTPMQKLRDAHDRHMEKALAANKAGDDEATKVHQVYMQKIRAKMDKLKQNEEIDLTEMEDLCEISKATLGSYVNKSHDQLMKHTASVNMKYGRGDKDATAYALDKDALRKTANRTKGMKTAISKLTKEEVDLQEQAPVAGSLYRHTVVVHVSDPDAPEEGKQKKALSVLTTHPKSAEATARKHFEKKGWRVHSVKSNNPVHEEVEQIDELSKKTLANYSQKAAHDVGNKMHSAGMDRGVADAARIADKPKLAKAFEKDADKKHSKALTRLSGIKTAAKKLAKEETLDEANVKVGSHVTLHPQMKGGSEEKVKVVGKNGDHIDVEYNDYMGRKQVKSVHHSFVKEDKEETMVSYKEFMASIEEGRIDDLKDKLAADREKRLNKMDYSKEKEDKKNPITKVKGHSYGAGEEEGEDEAGEKAKPAEPAQKRGRGRPAGSKSGVTKYN